MRDPKPWPDLFMSVAHAIKERSKDPSTQVGACLVAADNSVLAVSFNGPPPAVNDLSFDWADREFKLRVTIHAEENSLLVAAEAHGWQRLLASTMYVTAHPCPGCLLRMVRAGVRDVVWDARPEFQAKMVREDDRAFCRRLLADHLKGSRITKLVSYHGG